MPTFDSSALSVALQSPMKIGSSTWVRGDFRRYAGNPVVTPGTPGWGAGEDTSNINGPSVVKVPPGTVGALGAYYLYFAHHLGQYIRMAYAPAIEGPYTIYTGGVLPILETGYTNHIASPDVHIVGGEWRMYFHGSDGGAQTTRMATSLDGLTWTVADKVTTLCPYYLRAFLHTDANWYGIVQNGGGSLSFARNATGGLGVWTVDAGFAQPWRHYALEVVGDRLLIYLSQTGDAPESLMVSAVDTRGVWTAWDTTVETEALLASPLRVHEGVSWPIAASIVGMQTNVRQLRDPYLYSEGGVRYLFYTGAGEEVIELAVLNMEVDPLP